MIHFPKGGNWEERPMSFHIDTKQDIEATMVYGRVHELEGLSDRQIAVVEMKVEWGWTGLRHFVLTEKGGL
jgi:hypothetical protein